MREIALLAACSLVLVGCDKVYFARVDVGPYAGSTAIAGVTPAEHEKAVAAFHQAAHQLRLQCAAEKYPIITDSYESSQYRLTSCRAEGDYTRVQLADSANHVSVEIHKIGGMQEPSFFKKCRTRFAEALVAALPGDKVTVRYPYHWGRDVRSRP